MEKDQGKGGTIINGNNKKLLKLSQREGDVLELVAEGKANREIAEELGLSTRTVENHRYRIHKKLGLKGKGELKRWINHPRAIKK